MELMDHTALVTGGTAGIGLASARLLASEGATVIITGRDRRRGEKVSEEIGGDTRFIQADLADLQSVDSLVRQSGDVDIIVVNNAASFPAAPTLDQGVASFEATFDTNVRGAFFLVAGLLPGMIARRRGSIVNITTIVAFKGVAGASTYSASKPAVESLTRTWAAEFGSYGIRVNSVAPGPTPKAWPPNGARPMKSSVGHYRWAGPQIPRRSPKRCCFSPRHAPASSLAQPCTRMAAARPSEPQTNLPGLARWIAYTWGG